MPCILQNWPFNLNKITTKNLLHNFQLDNRHLKLTGLFWEEFPILIPQVTT